jgi:hypothetical protein
MVFSIIANVSGNFLQVHNLEKKTLKIIFLSCVGIIFA